MVLREIGWGDMDWINVAQDRHQWRVLVNTVMSLRALQNIVAEHVSASQEGLSSVELGN
jgi:hypothetical protein